MKHSHVDLFELSDRLQNLIERELDKKEEIEWLGQPIPFRLAKLSFGIFLFAIPWTAFALFWTAGAAGFKMPDFKNGFDIFPLFGIPFILIGIGMMLTPFIMMKNARKTVYVLTNQRAIIFQGGFSTTIRSFLPKQLSELFRKERHDGSGDIIFKEVEPTGNSHQKRQPHIPIGFIAIHNVHQVEMRIREMIEQHEFDQSTMK